MTRVWDRLTLRKCRTCFGRGVVIHAVRAEFSDTELFELPPRKTLGALIDEELEYMLKERGFRCKPESVITRFYNPKQSRTTLSERTPVKCMGCKGTGQVRRLF